MRAFAVLGLLFATVTAHAASSTPLSPGLYEISGTHSVLGPYTGQLLIGADRRAQRLVEFAIREPRIQSALGLTESNQEASPDHVPVRRIQQLWQGSLTPEGLRFDIRASRALTHFNGYTLPRESFAIQPVVISGDGSGTFALAGEGAYTESYLRTADAAAGPLFAPDQRTRVETYGHTSSPLVQLARKLGIDRVIKEYRKLDIFNPYRNRVEFQENQVWRYYDFTDLDFYRSNPDTLRVRNLALTPLSVAEARMRRLAFGPTLAEKESFKNAQTRLLLNELGVLEAGLFDAQGRLVARGPEGDTALWQGMYVWSQYLRHRALGDAVSYENFRAAVTGITHLIKISHEPDRFARYIHKSPASEPSNDPDLIQGQGEYAGYKYQHNSNNDMTKGILIGLAVAYQGLGPQDAALRAEIGRILPRLAAVEAVRKSDFSSGIVAGLDALYNGNADRVADFISGLDTFTNTAGDWFNANTGFHWGGIEDTSGIHLNTVSSAVQAMVAHSLKDRYGQDDRLSNIEKKALDYFKEREERMREARHGYLAIVAYAMTGDEGLRGLATEGARDLLEIPLEQTVGDMRAELAWQPDWLLSSWPNEPWKALKGLMSIDREKLQSKNQQRGAYGYPYFEGPGWSSSYAWKDTTNDFPYGGSRGTVMFSPDYLWAYWLARSAGVIGPRD